MTLIGEVMGTLLMKDEQQFYYEWDGKKFILPLWFSYDEAMDRARISIAQYEQWKETDS